MGGAFVGLADDATAAYTNPAGLVQVTRPEVSAEGQRSSYKDQFTDRGHAFGSPSGTGQDDVAGVRLGSTDDEINDLSFGSLVYPIYFQKHRFQNHQLVVAVYRQVLADFGTSFETQGAFVSATRLLPTRDSLRLRIVNEGASVAVKVTESLYAGIGLAEAHFELSSLTNRYNLQGGFYGPPDFAGSNVESFETQNGNGNDAAVNAGLLWKRSNWQAGVVYRQGPSFRFETSNQAGPSSGMAGAVFAINQASFHVPDFYGAGVAFQPTENWTLSAESDWIRYSQLSRGSIDIYSPPSAQNPVVRQLVANDAYEIHLGAEYVVTRFKEHPIYLRVGGWTDPDHRPYFESAPAATDVVAQLLSTLFQRGPDEIHVSGGVGFAFGPRFDVHAALDYSRLVSVASLTGVVHILAEARQPGHQ
jgi:long-subunit fatty acid transport protein